MKSLVLALLVSLAGTVVTATERPNIVLLVAEDCGRDWIHCYGATQQTPNIDALAKKGIRFDIAWGSPLPETSELMLLSGTEPIMSQQTFQPASCFANALRTSGYRTAFVGPQPALSLPKAPGALESLGFEEYRIPSLNRQSSDARHATASSSDLNGLGSNSDAIHGFCANFIRQDKRQPFLLYRFFGNSGTSTSAKAFGATVSRIDQQVGRIVDLVHDAGLAENTLIMFTSLTGSPVAGFLNQRPYVSGKGQGTDPGVHVPFIVRPPSATIQPVVSRDLISLADIASTVLQLAAIQPTHRLSSAGKSFVPSLTGSEDPFEKRNWLYSRIGQRHLIRDWHHILDSEGNFHDLTKDPLQLQEVSPLDKIAPGRRERLEMILERFSKTPVRVP